MSDPRQDGLIRLALADRAKLLALIRSMVGRSDLAEDIFQDLCVLVIKKSGEVLETEYTSSWLRIAARHLAMNARRKSASQAILLGAKIHELLEPEWRKLDDTAGPLLTDALELCLKRLKPAEKQVIVGRYADGLDYSELSHRLNRSVAALYKAMGRTHQKLAECIRRRVTSLERGHA
jgi:RNA polymerase sigma-70 factor (ECF subfamily)